MSIISGGSKAGEQARSVTVVTPSAVSDSSPTMATSTVDPSGSSTSQPVMPSQTPMSEIVPAPASANSFTIQLRSSQVGLIPALPAPVLGADVPSHTTYTPPELPGTDWSTTSRWPQASAFPAAPSSGTAFVFGHACVHHTCPFTNVQLRPDGSYTVRASDHVIITTPTGVLTYRVCAVGKSPKYGVDTLEIPTCSSHRDLVIATCEYEPGNASLYNIVVAATLVASKRH